MMNVNWMRIAFLVLAALFLLGILLDAYAKRDWEKFISRRQCKATQVWVYSSSRPKEITAYVCPDSIQYWR